MGRYEYGRSYRSRRRRKKLLRFLPVFLAVLVLAGVAVGGFRYLKNRGRTASGSVSVQTAPDAAPEEGGQGETSVPPGEGGVSESGGAAEAAPTGLDALLADAGRLAAGYDYDAAIALIRADTEYGNTEAAQAAVSEYEAAKAALVRKPVSEITHVFFHSLIADPSKAFDGEVDQDGYDQVMTTVDEFKKILQSLYDKGFVLVRLHDMAYETVDETGQMVMKAGDILLPEDKMPIVMSQDDLCYYPYMDGDGFASRIVIGEDGKPTCEMKQDDGQVVTGDYDLVPILEHFIDEHPDFSYRGARAVLAFTGYEGILGYRTAASCAQTNPDYEADRQAAARVAQCLKDNGWELASHSWGHLDLGTVEWERFRSDCDKWKDEVDSLIGPTDIILFPFGADVGDWHPYTHENERFEYLYQQGFRYFCNVDSSRYWVQLGDDFLRQGRRNLDGYRMWKDMTAEAEGRERRLEDLFHAEDVFDSARPTPVPEM